MNSGGEGFMVQRSSVTDGNQSHNKKKAPEPMNFCVFCTKLKFPFFLPYLSRTSRSEDSASLCPISPYINLISVAAIIGCNHSTQPWVEVRFPSGKQEPGRCHVLLQGWDKEAANPQSKII